MARAAGIRAAGRGPAGSGAHDPLRTPPGPRGLGRPARGNRAFFARPRDRRAGQHQERLRARDHRRSASRRPRTPRLADGPPRRDPALSHDELRAGHEAARGLGVRAGTLLLQLSPSRDVRSWPVARAEVLVRELAHEGRAVAVLSGPAETDEGNELEQRTRDVPLVRHWVGQRGLRALAGFFGASAEIGASYLGCDTGPTHLAAACGLPVTVLCGPHSHLRTGPWPVARLASVPTAGSVHVALRAADEPDCAPCFGRRCHHRDGPVCMARIDSDRVRMALAAPARA
ncbi:MAG: hypothetical protein NTV21_15625 [Planctomycetota bacterium]|nr:hypothetical protein [Planctomycetota bacterium]